VGVVVCDGQPVTDLLGVTSVLGLASLHCAHHHSNLRRAP